MKRPWIKPKPRRKGTAIRHLPRHTSKRAAVLEALRAGERSSVELAKISGHANASALAGTLRVLEHKGLITCATPNGKHHREDGHWAALRWRLATAVRAAR
jgi:hypothetical protein